MALETFKKAQARILDELERGGWEVKRGLTYPWAKKRLGREDVQLWFKTQSIYMGAGLSPAMKMARSICSDYRNISGAKVEQVAEYYSKLN